VVEDKRSHVVECKVQASRRELHNSFDENGTLRKHSEVSTSINADIRVEKTSDTKVTFTSRMCYLAEGCSVDVAITAAWGVLVRLSRDIVGKSDSDLFLAAAELPFKAGLCDESGDPFYNPVPGCTPDHVQKEIDEFVQFCATAVAEKDLDRVWKPP